MSKIPNLSEAEVLQLLTYVDLIPLMEKALIDFSAGNVQQPVRRMLPIEKDQRYFGLMPAASAGVMGAKWFPFIRKTPAAIIILILPVF